MTKWRLPKRAICETKKDVQGAGTSSSVSSAGANAIVIPECPRNSTIGAGATIGSADTTTWLILFEDGAESGGVGNVARNGSQVLFNTTSDRRLKENFRDSSVGLDDLMRINVQDFDFIADPNHDVNGFVAQDLFRVYPWAVTKGGDDPKKEPWGVDYGRLTPLIVKSIQDMQHEIDDLRARR